MVFGHVLATPLLLLDFRVDALLDECGAIALPGLDRRFVRGQQFEKFGVSTALCRYAVSFDLTVYGSKSRLSGGARRIWTFQQQIAGALHLQKRIQLAFPCFQCEALLLQLGNFCRHAVFLQNRNGGVVELRRARAHLGGECAQFLRRHFAVALRGFWKAE